ncbi:MAG TPA: DUF2752 domain-containing protein [Melioribacteraceae bacterium]|nr:DUF2752 domain-containing protein [Melioribacteraceae bacterium]
MYKLKKIFRFADPEAILWTAALVYLFFINPYEVHEFTFCPFHNIGIENCPGCGLGRSISFFYHGDLDHSLQTHPLGIAAFFLISARIIQLTRKMINNYQQSKEAQYGKRIRTNA